MLQLIAKKHCSAISPPPKAHRKGSLKGNQAVSNFKFTRQRECEEVKTKIHHSLLLSKEDAAQNPDFVVPLIVFPFDETGE